MFSAESQKWAESHGLLPGNIDPLSPTVQPPGFGLQSRPLHSSSESPEPAFPGSLPEILGTPSRRSQSQAIGSQQKKGGLVRGYFMFWWLISATALKT